MKKDKVAIVGWVWHRRHAPYDDESFEIWGINDLYLAEDVTRWDRWFQLHEPGYKNVTGCTTREEMYAEYKKWDCPVYMWEKVAEVPNSVEFPFKEIVEKFGNYFNNTMSWLIALAIHEGFKEIHVYGVDMATHSEYGHQRPSCEYFIGLAQGMGIKVGLPPETTLLKAKYLYGLESERENMEKQELLMRKQNVTNQMEEAEKILREVEGKINACRGAIVALDEIIATL